MVTLGKKTQYFDIATGCLHISNEFGKLCLAYFDAVVEDKELQVKFQFRDLPSDYALMIGLGMKIYDILVNNGISVKIDEKPLGG